MCFIKNQYETMCVNINLNIKIKKTGLLLGATISLY